MDQNDNPEKKRKPRKRKSVKKPLPEDIGIEMSALSAFFSHMDPEQDKYDKELKAVRANVGEYLSSYMLLGYTIDGKPVAVTYGKNQRDMDALSTSLHKYIFENCLRPPGFPPSHLD
jgi:hypothetical protein